MAVFVRDDVVEREHPAQLCLVERNPHHGASFLEIFVGNEIVLKSRQVVAKLAGRHAFRVFVREIFAGAVMVPSFEQKLVFDGVQAESRANLRGQDLVERLQLLGAASALNEQALSVFDYPFFHQLAVRAGVWRAKVQIHPFRGNSEKGVSDVF